MHIKGWRTSRQVGEKLSPALVSQVKPSTVPHIERKPILLCIQLLLILDVVFETGSHVVQAGFEFLIFLSLSPESRRVPPHHVCQVSWSCYTCGLQVVMYMLLFLGFVSLSSVGGVFPASSSVLSMGWDVAQLVETLALILSTV